VQHEKIVPGFLCAEGAGGGMLVEGANQISAGPVRTGITEAGEVTLANVERCLAIGGKGSDRCVLGWMHLYQSATDAEARIFLSAWAR